MPVETAEQIKQLMSLQAKEKHELQALCEGMGIDVKEISKGDLIRKLISLKNTPQSDYTKPQAIPLRTRDKYSNPIEDAKKVFLKWRKIIFETGGRRPFELLNNEGKQYSTPLKYIRCSAATAQVILHEGWYLPLDHQRDLITIVHDHPENFELNIIQKPDKSGKSWLMLHSMVKAA